MLQLTVKAESRKLKGSVIWIACFLIWNVLMTLPVPVRDILFGKLYVIVKVTLITQLWRFLLFCGIGIRQMLMQARPLAHCLRK